MTPKATILLVDDEVRSPEAMERILGNDVTLSDMT